MTGEQATVFIGIAVSIVASIFIPIYILKSNARQVARAAEIDAAELRGSVASHSDADLRGDQQKFIRILEKSNTDLLNRVNLLEQEVERLRGELATERADRREAQARSDAEVRLRTSLAGIRSVSDFHDENLIAEAGDRAAQESRENPTDLP